MLRISNPGFPRPIIMMLALFLLVVGTNAGAAATLQGLRASGALGESSSGYVVARDPSAGLDADAINKQRKAIYAKKAAAQGVSIEQVGKVYAEEILKKVPAGSWIQNKQGQWLQK